jgi:hypothetical protein
LIHSAKQTLAKTERGYEKQMDGLNERHQQSLAAQARAFQESSDNRAISDASRIERLEKSLNEKSTTSDPSQVSPNAEATLRRQITHEYEKIKLAEQDRNDRRLDNIQSEYRERLTTDHEKHQTRETKLNREMTLQRNLDRNEFNQHIADTEALKDSQIRSREDQHNRETELLNRNYTRLLDKKSRDEEEKLSVTHDNAANRIAAVRQEAEFNAKMAQRAFSFRQNELIREYEKKLADQKADYEGRLEDSKAQAQAGARDLERKLKNEMDVQRRSYEQKLTQQDAQYKERERYISQNYQDEIEKVKRSNALLIQKKS